MSKSPQYRYLGSIDGGVRGAEFPLVCGCCGKDIPLRSPTFVYFDMGPAEFFLVDEPCRRQLSMDEWYKRPASILRK